MTTEIVEHYLVYNKLIKKLQRTVVLHSSVSKILIFENSQVFFALKATN